MSNRLPEENVLGDDQNVNNSNLRSRENNDYSAQHQEEGQGADGYDSDADSSADEAYELPKEKSRKPSDNAFRQQSLKAYNPVFTAKTVIPIFVVIAVVFAPLGAAMWYASHRIKDLAIDYSQCENLASTEYFQAIPQEYLDFNFPTQNSSYTPTASWKLSQDNSQPFEDERNVCIIQFEIPDDMKGPIYFFYRLKNFYANHRRYAKSFSEDQIEGKRASISDIKDTVGQNCQPLLTDPATGKAYYPCGLIANSLFNDTYTTTLTLVNSSSSNDYEMTTKGIAWKSDKNRFKKTKYNHTEIVPPPYWYKMFPDGYNSTNVPDILTWYEFQNWMHTSGLPTFNKLAQRNDDDTLAAGTYQVSIGLHFPVLPYHGHKYIYISQRSVIGGKNIFLGVSWMAGGGLCLLVAISLLVVNLIKPRKTGDVNLLSWNKELFKQDEKASEDVVEVEEQPANIPI